MSRIIISQRDANLSRFANQLGALGSADAHKAMARAINRVTDTVHSRVVRAIRKQSDIPTAIIRRQITKRLASPNIAHGGALEGAITARGKPVSLKHFRPRQFKFGVKAKWSGKWHEYPSAFMGPRPGVIAPALKGHVWARTQRPTWVGGKRTPIEKLDGPAVPEELVRGESARIFDETVRTMLPQRVYHEISRLLR